MPDLVLNSRIVGREFYLPMFLTENGSIGSFDSTLKWFFTNCRKEGVYVGSINPAVNALLNHPNANPYDFLWKFNTQLRSGEVPGLEDRFQIGNRPLFFMEESPGDSRVVAGSLIRKTPGKTNWALNSPIQEQLNGYLEISEFLGRQPSGLDLATPAIIGPFWNAFKQKEFLQYLELQREEQARLQRDGLR